ncbi:MAG: type II secretion system F family protein [Acidobacteriia bacterium]|nr:type II secretion system F family protein [Terriglobia bacterium]
MSTSFAVIIFLIMFAFVMVIVSFSLRTLEAGRKSKMTGMLRTEADRAAEADSSILSETEEKSFINLESLPGYKHVQMTIEQAGLDWSPGMILGATVVCACLGLLLGFRVQVPVFREFTMAGLAILLGGLPYLLIRWKRHKRLMMFEEQFPEALDFLARSMRAGHAFSVSLELMAEEAIEPVKFEFRRISHEQNLGSPLEVSLKSLAARVPSVDVSFFVAAVLLQRDTGGNLAEILTALGYIIRERFRLKGQIRSASAHGRLTAIILSLMPIITMAALMIIAPDYLAVMARDEDGKWIIIGVVIAQLMGYAWMRKIINIKV